MRWLLRTFGRRFFKKVCEDSVRQELHELGLSWFVVEFDCREEAIEDEDEVCSLCCNPSAPQQAGPRCLLEPIV